MPTRPILTVLISLALAACAVIPPGQSAKSDLIPPMYRGMWDPASQPYPPNIVTWVDSTRPIIQDIVVISPHYEPDGDNTYQYKMIDYDPQREIAYLLVRAHHNTLVPVPGQENVPRKNMFFQRIFLPGYDYQMWKFEPDPYGIIITQTDLCFSDNQLEKIWRTLIPGSKPVAFFLEGNCSSLENRSSLQGYGQDRKVEKKNAKVLWLKTTSFTAP